MEAQAFCVKYAQGEWPDENSNKGADGGTAGRTYGQIKAMVYALSSEMKVRHSALHVSHLFGKSSAGHLEDIMKCKKHTLHVRISHNVCLQDQNTRAAAGTILKTQETSLTAEHLQDKTISTLLAGKKEATAKAGKAQGKDPCAARWLFQVQFAIHCGYCAAQEWTAACSIVPPRLRQCGGQHILRLHIWSYALRAGKLGQPRSSPPRSTI